MASRDSLRTVYRLSGVLWHLNILALCDENLTVDAYDPLAADLLNASPDELEGWFKLRAVRGTTPEQLEVLRRFLLAAYR